MRPNESGIGKNGELIGDHRRRRTESQCAVRRDRGNVVAQGMIQPIDFNRPVPRELELDHPAYDIALRRRVMPREDARCPRYRLEGIFKIASDAGSADYAKRY